MKDKTSFVQNQSLEYQTMDFKTYCQNIPSFLFRRDSLKLFRSETGGLQVRSSLTKKENPEFYLQLELAGSLALTNMFMLNMVLSEGPKILKLNNTDFAALEQVDLNISVADYVQPFPTVVVHLPEKYSESRTTRDPLEGEFTDTLHQATHRPLFVIVNWDKELDAIIAQVLLSSRDVYSTVFGGPGTIEENIAQYTGNEYLQPKSLVVLAEEKEIYTAVMRAAMNACMLAHNNGLRKLPDSKHKRRLRHFMQTNPRQSTRNELKACGEEYVFEQEITIKTTTVCESSYGHNGQEVRPHWRRGHWRTQRYGKGLSQSKTVLIEAVFVNQSKFVGNLSQTSVMHHD
jgi:hypothetical protein